jgi:hypothetical protein
MFLYSSDTIWACGRAAWGHNIVLYSSVPRNIKSYIYQLYIPRYVHRLIEDYIRSYIVPAIHSTSAPPQEGYGGCSAPRERVDLRHHRSTLSSGHGAIPGHQAMR